MTMVRHHRETPQSAPRAIPVWIGDPATPKWAIASWSQSSIVTQSPSEFSGASTKLANTRCGCDSRRSARPVAAPPAQWNECRWAFRTPSPSRPQSRSGPTPRTADPSTPTPEYLPPRLDQVQVCRVRGLEHERPSRLCQVEYQHVRHVRRQVVEHCVLPVPAGTHRSTRSRKSLQFSSARHE